MRTWLIGWRHKTNRCCEIRRTLGLRTKQWRTSFCDFRRVISRQIKLSRTRFMVISLSLHLYFTFLRKTVGKKIWKFRRSSTLNCCWYTYQHLQKREAPGRIQIQCLFYLPLTELSRLFTDFFISSFSASSFKRRNFISPKNKFK